MLRRRGRPQEGPELVDRLEDCSEEARQRLKVIFQTIAGVFTTIQACQILGINRSAFNKLRSQFITNAVHLLEPRKPGRKKLQVSLQEIESQKLREENERLKLEIKAHQLREEIGILMPHLIKPKKVAVSNQHVKKTKKKSMPTTISKQSRTWPK